MVIFAHDPGSTNYGYAIVEGYKASDSAVRFRILENGLCPHRIHNLKNHEVRRTQKNAYMKWVKKMIKKWKPDAIWAERYMTRGISGPTIESVNMMLGVLQSFDLPDHYIPAAVWKNAIRRNGADLKVGYKWCKTAPHPLDACLIGVYGLHQAFSVKDMGNLTNKNFKHWMMMVERSTTSKLFNRKVRQ